MPKVKELNRCAWPSNPLAIQYHDEEWGVPKHDDRVLFEYLILDAAQAGLSWDTVLKKRENYRKAFDNFDAAKIARYTDKKVARLLEDPGIIRNRLKVGSAVKNARAFLQAQEEFGNFDNYIWQFVGGATIQNGWTAMTQIPARTRESDSMSKDMKQRGFTFVGSTICYAFMQAAGLVNDHVVTCYRHKQVQRLR